MKKLEYTSKRKFQIWTYQVGHGSLLIRSPKSRKNAAEHLNIDLVFVGVGFINLPNSLNGVQITQSPENEPRQIARITGSEVNIGNYYRIKSNGCQYYIVALAHRFTEHSEDIFWNPFKN